MGGDLSISLIITLIGIGVVFIVLVVLAYILAALKVISGDKNKPLKENKPTVIESTPAVQPTSKVAAAIETNVTDENEIAAVIAAALAVYMGGQSNIVVRSIRRIEDMTPTWSRTGRHEQMMSRL